MITDISVTQDKVLMDTYKHIDLPVGTIIMNAGNNGGTSFGTAFLLCDGSSKLVSAYPELSAVLNFKYGGSSGSGSFNVPNFVDRFPMGLPSVGASTLTATDPYANSSLRQGGNEVIQSTQFPHSHSSVSPTITGISVAFIIDKGDEGPPRISVETAYVYYSDFATTTSNAPHLPPYYKLNYFIYTGKDVIG
jgi:microcystin-dependent protein